MDGATGEQITSSRQPDKPADDTNLGTEQPSLGDEVPGRESYDPDKADEGLDNLRLDLYSQSRGLGPVPRWRGPGKRGDQRGPGSLAAGETSPVQQLQAQAVPRPPPVNVAPGRCHPNGHQDLRDLLCQRQSLHQRLRRGGGRN
uniref:Uncharacterized protein n=1 Tax=Sphaerodactylus townsendi TaxID=933632 RepID=A0ACB8ETH0_9SAUR